MGVTILMRIWCHPKFLFGLHLNVGIVWVHLRVEKRKGVTVGGIASLGRLIFWDKQCLFRYKLGRQFKNEHFH